MRRDGFEGKRVLALLLLCVALGGPGAGSARAEDMPGDAQYRAAARLADGGKWTEAVPLFEKYLVEFPRHPNGIPARLRIGEGWLALEKPEAAAKVYEAILEQKPPDGQRAAALLGLGRARVALKADPRAVEPLTEAFSLTRYDEELGPLTGMLLGEVLMRAGKYRDAAEAFERVTRWPMHADAGPAYFRMGEAYRQAGSLLDAAVAFRNTAEKYWRLPLAAPAALASGDAFVAVRSFPEAEAEYRLVLRMYSQSAEAPRAQLGLGHVALAQGDYALARSAYQGAGLLYPVLASEAELRTADCYLAEKNYVEARPRYEALLGAKERPVASEAAYSLAQCLEREGKSGPAADQYRKVAADRGAGRWAHLAGLRLAGIRVAAGDATAAITLLRGVLATDPEPPLRDEASFFLGESLLRHGDAALAEAELTALLSRSPGDPRADLAAAHLARCRLEQGDAGAALARVAELLKRELAPEARAAALAAQGQAQLRLKQDGVPALREVLDRFPASAAAPDAAKALLVHYRETAQAARAAELVTLISSRYSGTSAAADGLLKSAEQALQGGRYEEAAGLFGQVLERFPDRAGRLRARSGLAEAAVLLKRQPAADAQVAEIARDEAPAGFVAGLQYRLARAQERAGNPDGAVAAYRAALAAGPQEDTGPGILLGLGRLLEAKSAAEAETLLVRLTESYGQSPQVPDALYTLAWLHLNRGRADLARPYLVRLSTEFGSGALGADAGFRLGEQAFARGDYDAAAAHYGAVTGSSAVVAAAAAYKLGWSLRRKGDHAGASRAFRAVVARFPQSELSLEARVRAGEASLRLAQPAQALEQFSPVLEHEAKSSRERSLQVQARVGAAAACVQQGDPDRARELTEGLALPRNGWYGARAQLVRSEAALLKEGPKVAAAEFARGASLFARYPEVASEAQFRAGECYEKLGNRSLAQAAWGRVLDLYGGTDWARRSRERLAARSTSEPPKEKDVPAPDEATPAKEGTPARPKKPAQLLNSSTPGRQGSKSASSRAGDGSSPRKRTSTSPGDRGRP